MEHMEEVPTVFVVLPPHATVVVSGLLRCAGVAEEVLLAAADL